MIERFNFYDVYGYLVPGIIVIAVFWLPFGLLFNSWPMGDWTSALAGVVLGYVAGHVIQSLATVALPHGIPLPHDALLNSDNTVLSKTLKDRVYDLIQNQFHIDVRPAPDSELGQRRQDAFLLGRAALIGQKAASYPEQFQGMYVLMRGLTAALVLGAAYDFGWASGGLLSSAVLYLIGILVLLLVLAVLALLALLADDPRKGWRAWLRWGSYERPDVPRPQPKGWRGWLLWDGCWLWIVTGISFFLGGLLGSERPQAIASAGLLLGIGASTLLVAYRCYRAYRYFATQFAASVYRGFAALKASVAEDKLPPGQLICLAVQTRRSSRRT